MINQINSISGIQVITRPSFKADNEKEVEKLPQQDEINAVASYGIASIQMSKKFNIKPIEAIVIDPNLTNSIDGEKIYTSDGKLYSIISEDDNTKTIYTPNEDDTRFFDSIITIDKETGNIIKEQNNHIEDGKYKNIDVHSYSKETGEKEFSTFYEDGNVNMVTKYVRKDNGDLEYYSHSFEDNKFLFSKTSEDGKINSCLRMTEDMKFVDFDEYKEAKNKESSIHAAFYNGGMISLRKSSNVVIPNLLGRGPLNDADLVPAEKYNLGNIKPEFEGEKTYFSNGAVESITTPDGTIYYTPDGEMSKAFSPTREIEFTKDGTQIITEKLGEDESRTTTHYKDSSIEVYYKKGNEYKTLYLENGMKPNSYQQGNITIDDEELATESLYYKQGILESAYNF